MLLYRTIRNIYRMFTRGHDLWILTKRLASDIQEAKLGFRAAGFVSSKRDVLCIKMGQLQDFLLSMSNSMENVGKTKNILKRLNM